MKAQAAVVPSVELAPRNKLGLSLPNPVLLAAGVAGYGDAAGPGLRLDQLGGFVTAPVSLRAWRGAEPCLAPVPGGILWQRGPWNPGLRRVLRDFGSLWRRSSVPVIVHVAGGDARQTAAVAGALEEVEGVAALEVDLPADPDAAAALVWALRDAATLPLLARLSLLAPDETALAAVEAGADALVIGQPPDGLLPEPVDGPALRGSLFSPGLASLIAARLAQVAAVTAAPLVACGGIWEVDTARQYLAAGAVAVQIDLASWLDPGFPGRVATALAGRAQA